MFNVKKKEEGPKCRLTNLTKVQTKHEPRQSPKLKIQKLQKAKQTKNKQKHVNKPNNTGTLDIKHCREHKQQHRQTGAWDLNTEGLTRHR